MRNFTLIAAIAITLAVTSSPNAQSRQRAIGGGQINPQEQIDNIREEAPQPAAGTVRPELGRIPGGETAPPPPASDFPGDFIPGPPNGGIPSDRDFGSRAVITPGNDIDQQPLPELGGGFQGKPAAELLIGNGQQFNCTKMGCSARISDNGLEILDVHHGGVSTRLGLQEGDLITEINGLSIDSARDYNLSLRDAVRLHDGWCNMIVRDIRFDQGYDVAEYIQVRAFIGELVERPTVRTYSVPRVREVYIAPRRIYNHHNSYGGGGCSSSRRHH